jgi:hypothetical protein
MFQNVIKKNMNISDMKIQIISLLAAQFARATQLVVCITGVLDW